MKKRAKASKTARITPRMVSKALEWQAVMTIPEHKLLFAMIDVSVADLVLKPTARMLAGKKPKDRFDLTELLDNQREARWFLKGSVFEMICANLQIDCKRARQLMQDCLPSYSERYTGPAVQGRARGRPRSASPELRVS